MSVIVSLKDVVDELDCLMDRATAYLNKDTGELFTLTHDDVKLVEDETDPDDLPKWQRDALPRLREVIESADWLPLPTKFDINEWEIMERFALSQRNEKIRDELLDAIHGRGAFRFFRDTVHRRRLQDAWHQFRTDALERIAIDWLDEHGIRYK